MARKDVYAEITNKLISDLEKGVRPWMRPWSAEGSNVRPLRENGKPYNGVNVLILWDAACENGYSAPTWMTYRQASKLGAQVRKGEKGTTVVYANIITVADTDKNGQSVEKTIPFMKGYTVFNVEQIDGLPEKYTFQISKPVENNLDKISHLEEFFTNTKAEIIHGGNRACYLFDSDQIRIPELKSFKDAESYYATLAHEMVHWTKHKDRLDRDLGRKRWGDEGYAREELVAEIGSAFLACDLGLYIEPREDHASYIDSWLKVLKDDKRAIFQASSLAQKAVDYLHKFQKAGE